MTARWVFEALAVDQFKNNKLEKNFYIYDSEISQNEWYSVFLITTASKMNCGSAKP
jgi:hypothetical protein